MREAFGQASRELKTAQRICSEDIDRFDASIAALSGRVDTNARQVCERISSAIKLQARVSAEHRFMISVEASRCSVISVISASTETGDADKAELWLNSMDELSIESYAVASALASTRAPRQTMQRGLSDSSSSCPVRVSSKPSSPISRWQGPATMPQINSTIP